MQQQILFSGITPAQFSKEIINGVKEELREEIARLMSLSMVEQKQNEEEFLTIKEAFTFLKCSETKLWRLRKDKKLRGYKNGRGILLKKSELENYINSSKQ